LPKCFASRARIKPWVKVSRPRGRLRGHRRFLILAPAHDFRPPQTRFFRPEHPIHHSLRRPAAVSMSYVLSWANVIEQLSPQSQIQPCSAHWSRQAAAARGTASSTVPKTRRYTSGFSTCRAFHTAGAAGNHAYESFSKFAWIGCRARRRALHRFVGAMRPLKLNADLQALSPPHARKFAVTGLKARPAARHRRYGSLGRKAAAIDHRLARLEDSIVAAISWASDAVTRRHPLTYAFPRRSASHPRIFRDACLAISRLPTRTALGKPELDQITPLIAPRLQRRLRRLIFRTKKSLHRRRIAKTLAIRKCSPGEENTS